MLEATRNSRKWQLPFFTIWSGQQFSLVGSSAVQFAIGWWLADLTGSATVLMAAFIATFAPQVILGPFAGALVDRWDRRKVMILSDAFVAVVSLWLAYLFLTGGIQVWHVYVAMLARAIGGVFQLPAMSASTALMVPEKHLSRVAGLNQTIDGLTKVLGPALGAPLIRFLSLPAVALVDAATAIPAIFPLFFVRVPQPQASASKAATSKPSVLSDLREGLRYMRHWPGMLLLFGIAMALYFVLAPTVVLAPLLITQHFKGDEFSLALFDGVWGVGLVLGGLCLSVWGGFRRRMYTLLLSILLMGVGFSMVGLAPVGTFWLALAGNFLVGCMQSMAIGTVYAVLQANVAPEMQGRVYTVVSAAIITVPLGLVIAGPMADVIGVQPWYVIGGFACMLMGVGSFFVPTIMHIERRIDEYALRSACNDIGLPLPLMTSEPGSFAQRTIAERKPQIIRRVIEDNGYPPDIVQALEAFGKEIASRPICPLQEQAPDAASWNRELAAYDGRTWLEVPWYFAEAYFYRRLLEAVRYFQPGPWERHDPFERQKREQGEAAVECLARDWDQFVGAGQEVAFDALLHSCLWGNRVDLSNYTIDVPARGGLAACEERHNLLVDHTGEVRALLAGGLRRVDFVNDNVGLDLLFDLALADFLLDRGWVREVVFHLKERPFFVSDAMPKDVQEALSLMQEVGNGEVRGLRERLHGHVNGSRLILTHDPFWTSWRMFRDFSTLLRDDLACSDLVFLKGDVNYRRLLGDRHWPHTASLEEVTAYFPASFLVLRTLKGEIMVGLEPGQAEALAAEDPAWLINGKRGIVQLVIAKKAKEKRHA